MTDVFIKAARVVGDLDDEFYHDERRRDVWNEASAVGFQLNQWCAIGGVAVLPWVAGRVGAYVALGLFAVCFLTAVVTIAYARARDVDVYAATGTLRLRGVLAVVLCLVGAVGIYTRLGAPLGQDPGTWIGGIVGAICGVGIAIVAHARYRRRRAASEAEADRHELDER